MNIFSNIPGNLIFQLEHNVVQDQVYYSWGKKMTIVFLVVVFHSWLLHHIFHLTEKFQFVLNCCLMTSKRTLFKGQLSLCVVDVTFQNFHYYLNQFV